MCVLNEKIQRKTKCNHIFCKSCIYQWVESHSSTCPICRTKLNKYNVSESYDPDLETDYSFTFSTHEFILEIINTSTSPISPISTASLESIRIQLFVDESD